MVDTRSGTWWTLRQYKRRGGSHGLEGPDSGDQRLEFVSFRMKPRTNIRELCRRYEVGPTIAYKWMARYRSEGVAGWRIGRGGASISRSERRRHARRR